MQPFDLHRQTADKNILVKVLNRAAYDDRLCSLYRQLTAGQDPADVKNTVDRYRSSLLMRSWLIRPAVKQMDSTNRPDLYDLAELAEVTISHLVVRLHRLDLIYVPEETKDICSGRDAFVGQTPPFS